MLLAEEVGVTPTEVNYVAYDGGGELLAGILGGDVAFAATGVGEVTESAAAGDVRILAVTSEEPVEGVDAPTLKDEGVDLVVHQLARHRGAPRHLRRRDPAVVDAITEMHDSDAWQQALEDQGWTDAFITGDDFSTYLDDESEPRRGRHERAGPGMSSAAPGSTREQGRSEHGVALFLGALGLLVIVQALLLPESRIARGPGRPRRGPVVVGGLLVIVARLPRRRRLRGGRGEPEGGEDIELTGGTDWRTVADAGGGVRRQRPADRAPRLAHLRRDPVLGVGLRPRQPALRP